MRRSLKFSVCSWCQAVCMCWWHSTVPSVSLAGSNHDLKCVSQTCNTGWRLIDFSLMLIRQTFSGLGLDVVQLSLAAVDCYSISEQRPSEPVTICVCLESPHLLTSALRNMFLVLVYAQHASTGSLRFVIFEDFLTPSLQQHLYMLSLYLIMTNHWNKEVWLWFVSPASLRATLAGHPSVYPV